MWLEIIALLYNLCFLRICYLRVRVKHGRLCRVLVVLWGTQLSFMYRMVDSNSSHLSLTDFPSADLLMFSINVCNSFLMRSESAFFLIYTFRLTLGFLLQRVFSVESTMSWSLIPGTILILLTGFLLLDRTRSEARWVWSCLRVPTPAGADHVCQ